MDSPLAWTAIAAVAVTTWATRYTGFAGMRRVRITPTIERFLETMSTSVLIAIVATAVVSGGGRTAAAVAVGVLVMVVLRSPVAAMLVGIAVAAAWNVVGM